MGAVFIETCYTFVMIFYTGKGDGGASKMGKKKIKKNSPVFCALGDLDELNSAIGAVRASIKDRAARGILLEVQENLFIVQAHVAALAISFAPPAFGKEKIEKIERIIERAEKEVKPERKFIIPGEDRDAALLDWLRAIARRAERSAVAASSGRKPRPEILSYLNRISSLFFALARLVTRKRRKKERHPSYR